MKIKTFLKTHVSAKADRSRQTTVPMSYEEIAALDRLRSSMSMGEKLIPRAAFVRMLVEYAIDQNAK